MKQAERMTPPRHWELRLGNERMADLYFATYDFPWIGVSVEPSPAMDSFWRNFSDPSLWDEADEGISVMLSEIRSRGGFVLLPDGDAPTQEFTLVNFDRAGGDLRY